MVSCYTPGSDPVLKGKPGQSCTEAHTLVNFNINFNIEGEALSWNA